LKDDFFFFFESLLLYSWAQCDGSECFSSLAPSQKNPFEEVKATALVRHMVQLDARTSGR
jgi:hypothetical protein